MSEADTDRESPTGRDEVWIEKYRPQRLADIVGQDTIVERLQSYVDRNDLSHMLFSGPAGIGKTTCSMAIARELYGDDWEENFLELNASDERGIDVVRDRIKSFARTSFGGYDYRIIFLDEADALCVPPGTEVVTGYPSSPEVTRIENVDEDGEPIPSVDFETNEIQSDKGKLVDSGVADFFELELADGRTVLASLTHPFFVVDEDGTLVERELRELRPGDEIADFKTDIGVSRCEVCGDWTAGRFCSIACKDEGHIHSDTNNSTRFSPIGERNGFCVPDGRGDRCSVRVRVESRGRAVCPPVPPGRRRRSAVRYRRSVRAARVRPSGGTPGRTATSGWSRTPALRPSSSRRTGRGRT
jgi:replication factor C small subunit